MSSKKASNNPGLCPDFSGRTTARNQISSLSLSTDKNPPHCQMLVVHPVFYLFSYILPRDPQDRLKSNKQATSSLSCDHISNFISMYPWMSKNPRECHRISGGNVVQWLLALLYPRGRWFGSLMGYYQCSGFSGLDVTCWPLVPKFTGSHPAEAIGFLGWKNPQHAFLRRGSKAVGPMS